jgi:hypothetical protein
VRRAEKRAENVANKLAELRWVGVCYLFYILYEFLYLWIWNRINLFIDLSLYLWIWNRINFFIDESLYLLMNRINLLFIDESYHCWWIVSISLFMNLESYKFLYWWISLFINLLIWNRINLFIDESRIV